ncbi:hypothetical protein AMTRI_Chr13g90990 [Amborella trichopoda]
MAFLFTRPDPSYHKFLHIKPFFPSQNPKFVSSCPRNPKFLSASLSPPLKQTFTSSRSICLRSRSSDSSIWKCRSERSEISPEYENSGHGSLDAGSGLPESGWDLQAMAAKMGDPFLQAARSASKWFHDYFEKQRNSSMEVVNTEKEDCGDWDWERWKRHFKEVEEQEKLVSVLKAQLRDAVQREDYNEAAKLKVAIAAAAVNDTVGRVLSRLNKALKEERYEDAAFIRDNAGAGLVGWWAGISEDSTDPYGRIFHISSAHGRYVARSYSSRQLATASPGVPLFEIYVTVNNEGEYKLQAVYLSRNTDNGGDMSTAVTKPTDACKVDPLNGNVEVKPDFVIPENIEELEDGEEKDDDVDMADEGLTKILNILRDMIPGGKVKVVKVIAPGKVDRDLISKVFEQIMDEEDEENDMEASLGSVEEVEVNAESGSDEIELDVDEDSDFSEDQREIAVKLVIGGLVQKMSSGISSKTPVRVPATLAKRNHSSFSLCIKKDNAQSEYGVKRLNSSEKSSRLTTQDRLTRVTSDFTKVLVTGEKIPVKVIRDVGDFINLALKQAQNRQDLSGCTVFNRIEIPATTSDPLSGLYIGAHGPHSSEVINLRCRFGQWPEDGTISKSRDLEFYEYVEALKLTGDPYVPAGQVAFRAKIGKRNQMPHKGIIPEEFGVVARYKGQGRLAEPGFKNPRWVDGELVVLDGKHIKSGPMVGFVYWAPEYHFLVFFNRLRLQS